MNWAEKVEALTPAASYTNIEKLAGWKRKTLAGAMAKGARPRVDKAIALARALTEISGRPITAEVLFDDTIPLPPIGYGTVPEDFSLEDWAALRRFVRTFREPPPQPRGSAGRGRR
jgi:hypothetical protein